MLSTSPPRGPLDVDTLARVRCSYHARCAVAVRGVPREAVLAALRAPEVTEEDSADRTRYVRGPLAVVLDTSTLRVVTVLLRASNALDGASWTDEDARRVFAGLGVAS